MPVLGPSRPADEPSTAAEPARCANNHLARSCYCHSLVRARRLPHLVVALALAGGCVAPTEPEQAAAAPSASQPPPPKQAATAPANGFGAEIAWRGLDEGLAAAAADHRPLMLLIHASWCRQCKALRPAFSDPALVRASEALVMVNLDQDEEPRSRRYSPDGDYVPRVIFLTPDGAVDPDLRNPGRGRYHHFFSVEDDLVAAMQRASARHGQPR